MRIILTLLLLLAGNALVLDAQNCLPPTLNQEIFVFPYEAQFTLQMNGASGGFAELVPEGAPFDNPVTRGIGGNTVTFPVSPNTAYQWRARVYCSPSGDSDWSPVYHFVTPPPCPATNTLAFNMEVPLHFPAAADPNITLFSCGSNTGLAGYVYKVIIPYNGEYRLRFLDGSGGDVQSSINYDPGNYCRGGLQCLTPTSDIGSFATIYGNAGDQIHLAFSAKSGVTASRSVRLEYAPCPEPQQLLVDTLKPTLARLRWIANTVDVEIVPEVFSFTGLPQYEQIQFEVTAENLIPGADYKWRARGNCSVNVSDWVDGPGFTIPYACVDVPYLKCDSLYPGFKAGIGRQKMIRYAPSVSHELRLTVSPTVIDYSRAFQIALRDTTLGDCFSADWIVSNWPVYYDLPADSLEVSLGYVEKGKVYYVFADRWGDQALAATLQWHCPEACPPPGFLNATDITANTAKLTWANNGLSTAWEIEFQTDTLLFNGTPQLSGTGDFFVLNTLTPFTRYYWRIRQVCTGNGPGSWSNYSVFYTEHDCDQAPVVPCQLNVATSNLPGVSLLATCDAPSQQDGTERYFRFTPTFDGYFTLEANTSNYVRFAYKPAGSGCGADSLWNCLGGVIPGFVNSLPLGLLLGGQSYLIAADFLPSVQPGTETATFQILCPSSCPTPDSLSQSVLSPSSVQLNWASKPNQTSWDIEVVVDSLPFSGTPNYTSTQNNYVVQNLSPDTRYKWRVRGVCGSFGFGDWSNSRTFFTEPDCQYFPLLTCDQKMVLHFNAGPGYWNNLPVCDYTLSGDEQILQFSVSEANATRYIYLPKNTNQSPNFGFFLKKAGISACADVNGWQCISNNWTTSFITLNNLEQGATYYLLCKRLDNIGTRNLSLSFHCTIPCFPPENPTTTMYDETIPLIYWDGGNGPWKYQMGVINTNGTEVLVSGFGWRPSGQTYLDLFPPLLPAQVHGWRVRTICDNGDTSAWTPYQYFKLSAECQYLGSLPCFEATTVQFRQQGGYHYRDLCSNSSAYGQQRQLRIVISQTGAYQLFINAGNHPAQYALSKRAVNNCLYETWQGCTTVSGLDTLALGNLTAGTYVLHIATTDIDSFAHTVQLICPCPAVSSGTGALFGNGTAVLKWSTGQYLLDWDIELQPVGQAFTGVPNYSATEPSLSVNGLISTGDYAYRVRLSCGAGQYGPWSNVIPVAKIPDCATLPELGCGDTLVMAFPAGDGKFNYDICNELLKGNEFYFSITPTHTGFYEMKVVKATGALTRVHFGFLEDCNNPEGQVTCIGQGGVGTYSLGYLEAGRTYHMLGDNPITLFGTTYTVTLHCPIDNDNPYVFYPPYSPGVFVVSMNDSCQVFTNRNATASFFSPDMTVAPSTWYDQFEHDVWFAFTAPPGGTVQIKAASDPGDPMDPQIALYTYVEDTLSGPSGDLLLATGEDSPGLHPADATMVYTGLTPGVQYYIVVDGANASVGRFCLEISDMPDLWQGVGCQTFASTNASFGTPGAWRNLYAGSSEHVTGTLMGAIKTTEDLGNITISSEILSEAPILPNGQKLLPRYFNIETENAPQQPVTLRLFFSAEDLAAFNLTPPFDSAVPFDLGLTHYDGNNEDCDPTNNNLSGGILPVSTSSAVLVGENGSFYLEAVFNSFSEFGAAIKQTVGSPELAPTLFSFKLYPNPTEDVLQMQVNSLETGRGTLRIFDLQGRLLQDWPLDLQRGMNQFQWSTRDWTPGMYRVSLYLADGLVHHAVLGKM